MGLTSHNPVMPARAEVLTWSGLEAEAPEEQRRRGCLDTVREIGQQPATWIDTVSHVAAQGPQLQGLLAGRGPVVLTGSGSSLFVAETVALGLQAALRVPVQAVVAGDLLTHPGRHLDALSPALLVSFARSGDSPESAAVVDRALQRLPACQHLIVTCNARGALATRYVGEPRVARLVLDDRTNDRSLVMTSSFSNMALAARYLGMVGGPEGYRTMGGHLADAGRDLLLRHGDALARAAVGELRVAVFLGSGVHYGTAHESSLKMLEMTAGRTLALCETFLGLRHGPLTAITDQSLVVGYLSVDPAARVYELDVLRDVRRKRPGATLVVAGPEIPDDLRGPRTVAVDVPGALALGEENAVILDVLVGQLLGLHRCLSLGLAPDAPSPDGVITRVVPDFPLY